jgi:hypothetical protein
MVCDSSRATLALRRKAIGGTGACKAFPTAGCLVEDDTQVDGVKSAPGT